ncbi:MAG: hypothetical protein HUK03_07065 [Bacteroidaceae bacterium]|nr:hypothetical protein [Bacteroidaceae bacterium]
MKKLDTSLECIQDLNATNVWMLDEFELAAMWERDRKEDDFSISEEKLLNVMRIAFEVVHYNKEDPRDVARYEDGKWATFTRGSEHKGNVAIRKKNIYSLSDLSYENVKHITAATLLELIDRNFGGGWDAISLAVKDIIESGFDISTTQLPASRMHIAGGTMERKVAQGYDVLEIARGTWIEAIFAKKKDPVAKLPRETSHNPLENEEGERMDDEDERSVADPNEGDEEDQNDDTFYSSYSPEAEVKQEDEEEGFISMEEE